MAARWLWLLVTWWSVNGRMMLCHCNIWYAGNRAMAYTIIVILASNMMKFIPFTGMQKEDHLTIAIWISCFQSVFAWIYFHFHLRAPTCHFEIWSSWLMLPARKSCQWCWQSFFCQLISVPASPEQQRAPSTRNRKVLQHRTGDSLFVADFMVCHVPQDQLQHPLDWWVFDAFFIVCWCFMPLVSQPEEGLYLLLLVHDLLTTYEHMHWISNIMFLHS